MTSTATLLSVGELKLAGFVEHELLVPLGEKDKRRWLFVTQNVDDLLSGKLNPSASFPSAQADATIARFARGMIVSVSRKMVSKADFKQLKSLDEAWTMQFPGPGAGWRLFGRFARRNIFVGLDCHSRDDCAPLAKYNQIARDMIADWDTRFALGPLKASNPGEYLSQPFYDQDW